MAINQFIDNEVKSNDVVLFVAGADIPIPQNAYFPAWGFPPAVITVPIADRGAT